MFDSLFNVIFPYLGDFFGKITGFASLSVGDFINYLTGNLGYYSYTNLFNGVVIGQEFVINDAFKLIMSPLRWLLRFMFNSEGIPLETPLWAALLLVSIVVSIVFGIIKFLRTII